MKQTLSVLVENRAGVLNRITSLFSRRAFNIDSLAVGVTDDPTLSRITIIVDSGNSVVEQVEKQLNKLVEVVKVRRLDDCEGKRHQEHPGADHDHMQHLRGQGGGHFPHLHDHGAVGHPGPGKHL